LGPLQWIAVVLVFGLLITFHEAGHMFVARWNGVKVLEFNIGFGPPLARWGKGETRYGIRLIPLGGYVRLAGLDDGDATERSFNKKPVWRRITIIVAGAVTNLLLPLVIFFFTFIWISGPGVSIEAVTLGSPAANAGIRPGDNVLSVNGQAPADSVDFRAKLNRAQPPAAKGAQPVPAKLVVKKTDGSTQTLAITPELNTDDPKNPRWIIGVIPSGTFSIPDGARVTVQSYGQMYVAIFGGLAQLVSGKIPGGVTGPCGLSGPVGIVRETAAAAAAGLVPLASIAAFISVNLGILNLLPLPALDGGRLLFLVVEAVRGRPIDPEREQRVHYIGLVVLMTLILVITYNDLSRIGTPLSDLASRCQ